MVMEGEEFHKVLRCWPRARLFRQRPLACAQLRVRIQWWHWWGRPKTLLAVPIRGRASFPFPQAGTTFTPRRSHWPTGEPLRSLGGAAEGSVRRAQAGGMDPWDLAKFSQFSPRYQFHHSRLAVQPRSSLPSEPSSPRQSRLFFSPHRPPTIDTTSPSRLGIYCRPPIPPSLVPAPAGTWPRALSTCLPGDTGWQLPELKETIATE